MQIYIGADHRGYELKQSLIEFLQKAGHRVEDCGNQNLDPADDYVQFGSAVAEKVSIDPDGLGIVICGSGAGMAVVANKIADARCVLGFDPAQVKHARESDNCNVLSLPADHIDVKLAQALVTTFIETPYQANERRDRRLDQIHKLEFNL